VAYRFVLPAEPAYVLDSDSVRAENGMHQRRWRWAVAPKGPFCMIQAVEQPNFTPAFPDTSLALFESTAQAGDIIVRNEALAKAPPGAVAGVAQEMTTTVRLTDGSRVAGRIFQRDLLTPGKTLLTLITAAPEDMVDTCGVRAVLETLVPTGREAPTDPPRPPPVPAGSATPTASPSPPVAG
jgi:hypothetical protein